MAVYLSPTVIQQSIPVADMTPLERLVLSHMFDATPVGKAVYFHTNVGPQDDIWLPVGELRAAFAASAAIDSTATTHVGYFANEIAHTSEDMIEIDFTDVSWEPILQDIVRRSAKLRYVTVVTSFTCSKMWSDGFGGRVVLITADAIKGKSTRSILREFLAQENAGAGRNRREGEG
jgi:hypothetical protein